MNKKKKYVSWTSMVLLVIFLAGIYTWYHKRVLFSSDSTTMLPVALDWLHGNFLLKDWVLGTNNFFFSETCFYMPGLILGISSSKLLQIVPALTFAIFIVFTSYVFIWKEERNDAKKENAFVTILYVLIVGTVSYGTAYTLLNANSHNGVYVFITLEVFLVFLFLQDNKKKYLVIYMIIGALMLFSDGVYLMALIAPMCGMCCYYILVNCIKKNKKEILTYGWIMGATIASFIGGKAITIVLESVGGLETRGLPMHLVSLKDAVHRFFDYKEQVLVMWGYNSADTSFWGTIYNDIVIVILIATALAFIYQIVDIVRGKIDVLRLLLWLIVFFNIAGCLFTDTVIFHRYIVPSYLYGTMLLMLSVRTVWIRLQGIRSIYFAVGMLLASGLLVSIYRLNDAAKIPDNIMQDRQELAQYILEHDLGNGYGDFWIAPVVSCYTEYNNDVYPIISNEQEFEPYVELVKKDWYGQKDMHYIVVNADDTYNLYCKKEQAVAIIGQPDIQQTIGAFEILYWKKDISEYVKKD